MRSAAMKLALIACGLFSIACGEEEASELAELSSSDLVGRTYLVGDPVPQYGYSGGTGTKYACSGPGSLEGSFDGEYASNRAIVNFTDTQKARVLWTCGELTTCQVVEDDGGCVDGTEETVEGTFFRACFDVSYALLPNQSTDPDAEQEGWMPPSVDLAIPEVDVYDLNDTYSLFTNWPEEGLPAESSGEDREIRIFGVYGNGDLAITARGEIDRWILGAPLVDDPPYECR